MYHQTTAGGSTSYQQNSHEQQKQKPKHKQNNVRKQHQRRGSAGGPSVDQVKLLADVGYIADRLRSLEQRWELAELKDLHKRIVVLGAFDRCTPVNVVRAIRDDQLRPVQSELHGHSHLQQEVERAAEAAHKVEEAKRQLSQKQQHWNQSKDEQEQEVNDETLIKLTQLEEFLIAFYRSYIEVRRISNQRCSNRKPTTKKVRDKKVFPFLLSSPSSSSSLPSLSQSTPSLSTTASTTTTTTNKCHYVQPEGPPSFSTSQADRTMNQDREPRDPNVETPEPQSHAQQANIDTDDNQGDDNKPVDLHEQPQHSESATSSSVNGTPAIAPTVDSSSSKDDDDDEGTATTTTATTTTTSDDQQTTVVNVGASPIATATTARDAGGEKRPSLDGPNSSPLTSATGPQSKCGVVPSGDSTEPEEEEDDDDDEDHQHRECGEGGTEHTERNKLRKRISELANNFASAKQFQQMCDNIDSINDVQLRALIRELKRKIEFAERMNWLCEYLGNVGLDSGIGAFEE